MRELGADLVTEGLRGPGLFVGSRLLVEFCVDRVLPSWEASSVEASSAAAPLEPPKKPHDLI